ncbi:YutD family protein [Paenibacillus lactis]|uniref:YutD family protein n=1 Tax=Paenibacillus lactis TaxID=228574 RepID=UPI0011A753E7
MIIIGNKSYELLKDYRNGWNLEAFRDRYSEVLDRYDYIVGDWGYNQLRLKGFYRDNHPKAAKDSTFSSMSDYINEYCNFGCAHFVLQKTKEHKEPKDREPRDAAEVKEVRPDEENRGNKEAAQDGAVKSKKDGREREVREAKREQREQRDQREPREKGPKAPRSATS